MKKSELQELLGTRLSKVAIMSIAECFGEDTRDLMLCLKSNSNKVAEMASWLLTKVAKMHRGNFEPHISELVEILATTTNNSIRRNIMNALQFTDIPESTASKLIDLCFSYATDSSMPIAVRVHSVSVLLNFVTKFPEIKNEVQSAVETGFDTAPGLVSKARNTLKVLRKI